MMDRSIDVSVIMPLFNKAPYVAEAIRSVLDQDYADFELVICDDGSKDGSQDVVRSFDDTRIRFYQNEKNLGTPGNGNRCFDLCRGTYIVRMDADDIMPAGRIKRQVEYLRLHPKVAIVSGYNKVLNKEEVITIPCDDRIIRNEMYFTNTVSQPASAFNLQLLNSKGLRYEDTGPWIGEDWILFHSVLKHFEIVNLPEIFNFYRLSESNISGARDEKYFKDIRSVFRHVLKDLDLEESELDLQFLFRRQIPSGLLKPGVVGKWKSFTEKWLNYSLQNGTPSVDYMKMKIDKAWDFLFFRCAPDKTLVKEFREYRKLSFAQWRYLISIRVRGNRST